MTSPPDTTLRDASPRQGWVVPHSTAVWIDATQVDSGYAWGTTPGERFCFGRYQLIVRERLLLRDGRRVPIGSRAFDLLLALVERAGETVNRQELFERVWPGVFVAKVNLRVHIASLRKALADGQDGNRFIVSVAGRGYRFVAAVHRMQSLAAHGCVVDLAAVANPAHVVVAVATALGFEVDDDQALSCVLGYLKYRRMLLAFENCEHVFAGVMQLTERLLTEAPRVQVLIGSRASSG